MAIVKPSLPKHRIENTSNGIEIIIPAKRNIFILLFLSAWLVGWAFGEVFAISQILVGKTGAGIDAFLIVWLVMWTLGGGFAILVWLWNLNGRERVLLEPGYLIIKREVFGKGPNRQYELQHIRNIRVSNASHNIFDFRSGLQFWGLGGGLISFDYGADTIRFGGSVSESEASMIIEKLKETHALS